MSYELSPGGVLVPAFLKRRYIEAEVAPAQPSVGLAGLFRCVVRRADGSVKQDTGWFKNLILDAGLNRLGTAGIGQNVSIGTGTTAPDAAQTGLANWAATTTTQQSESYPASSSPDYYRAAIRTARFALGALNGNYTEVGVGWGSNTLFSRALIVDGGGSPTSISVLSNEQLDVSYQLRFYPVLTDATYNVTIGGTNHTITRRLARAVDFMAPANAPWSNSMRALVIAGGGTCVAYNGTIGAITGTPSGASSTSSSESLASYVNGSYASEATGNFALNSGNVAGGITALTASTQGGALVWQYGISPAIPKDATKTLALTFRQTWARRP